MKRITVWLLLTCVLLCGCAEEAPEVTTSPTELQTEATEYVEPTGHYDPNSQIEAQTGGAVRAYPLEGQRYSGFAVMGNDVLVFASGEHGAIRKLSGGELYESAVVETAQPVSPAAVSTQVTDNGVSYFDSDSGEMVLLDTSLREIRRIKLPEDPMGKPIMSADGSVIYYCTSDAIRAYDMNEGFSRLVKQMSGSSIDISRLLMNDTILALGVTGEDGYTLERMLFVSVETGETLMQSENCLSVSTFGDRFYSIVQEGAMQPMVFGQGNSRTMLLPEQVFPARRWYLESRNAAVIWSEDGRLDYYDLESGKITASVTLENLSISSVAAASEEQKLYLMGTTDEGFVLCLWDLSMTPGMDETVYTGPVYTAENPDTAGLEDCRELAQQIGQKHNIEVLIGSDATAIQPMEYALETEYQVPMIRRELEQLDTLLDSYPENFLSIAARGTDSGVVRICLVRSVTGTPESGNPVEMDGACFWVDENAYAAIPVGATTEKTFHHTMFHVLETRIMSRSKYCYEWETHNPEGFEYDYNYTDYLTRTDSQYLQGENWAFIDLYSMTFPREDRATIMAYAMTEGNADCFQSEIMQEKLLAICKGIRKAFGLEKSKETYIWEQYLNEPLT